MRAEGRRDSPQRHRGHRGRERRGRNEAGRRRLSWNVWCESEFDPGKVENSPALKRWAIFGRITLGNLRPSFTCHLAPSVGAWRMSAFRPPDARGNADFSGTFGTIPGTCTNPLFLIRIGPDLPGAWKLDAAGILMSLLGRLYPDDKCIAAG